MLKNNKQGFTPLLFNPYILIPILVIAVFLLPISPFRLEIFNPNVDFAGFSFSDSGTILTSCNSGGGQTSVSGGDITPLFISASAGGRQATRELSVDVTGIDELIVLYEGFVSCDGLQSSGGIGIGIRGDTGGSVGFSGDIGCNSNSKSLTISSSPTKLKNNYDGTWSSMKYLGYGDAFSVIDTRQISGTPKLMLTSSAGNACGLGGSGTSSLTIYNIGRKVSGFAQCKADEYVKGVDNSGKVVCSTFPSIVLNSEEFAKESDLKKQQRLIEELTAKNDGLTSEIILLKQQFSQQQENTELLNKINLLEQDLKNTKSILSDVQANDKRVIDTIVSQEQFKRPNFVKEFFNKIIAWIKNLF